MFDISLSGRIGATPISVDIASECPVVALVGPSGAGKTTILNMIAGLVAPQSGHIRIAGRTLFDSEAAIDVPAEERGAGYVFQDVRLFPHMSVAHNIGYARRGEGDGGPDADAVLAKLGIASLLDRRPQNLSGGEARRVAIARALLSSPRFLLLDEALSSLNAERASEVIELLIGMASKRSLPMIFVSHDLAQVERLTDAIIPIEPC